MATSTESQVVGVAAALASATPTRTALSQFSLFDRVALVTGGHRGIGLEIALALAEAGAIVYCLDLPTQPDQDWLKVQSFASQLPAVDGKRGRLEYVAGNVTDQSAMWSTVENIVKKEGRIDVCVANAGILQGAECLEYPAEEFRKVRAKYLALAVPSLPKRYVAHRHQRKRCTLHCTSCRTADGTPRDQRQYHHDCEHEWQHRESSTFYVSHILRILLTSQSYRNNTGSLITLANLL